MTAWFRVMVLGGRTACLAPRQMLPLQPSFRPAARCWCSSSGGCRMLCVPHVRLMAAWRPCVQLEPPSSVSCLARLTELELNVHTLLQQVRSEGVRLLP